jgi:two-component system sensor histidine kinase KdpD
MPGTRESRPDPDALLSALRRKEDRSRRGQLKVFFGMSPGVGKTYAMLEAARRDLSDGRKVLVGFIETHGRVETEALLDGLTILPRKTVEYRGVTLEELDLEGILAQHPQLVVVDELPHTNAPGARHPKRYQDVLEILVAGIDVYTTLNVQHIESRTDIVQQITGVVVREVVPDSVLELADEIELVDITPADLLERLAAGKVYLGDRAQAAAANYFQESNLNALRELALRVTAERVDKEVSESLVHRQVRPALRTGERLLATVGSSPFSTRVIRWVRRMAYALDAPWMAVHVESFRPVSDEARHQLDANLALARSLGAEVIVTRDDDIPGAILRVATERGATQIVVGKTRGPRAVKWFRGGTLAERLLWQGSPIDVYVHTFLEKTPARVSPLAWWTGFFERPGEYLRVLLVVSAMTGIGLFVRPWTGYWAVALFYLLAVIILGLQVGRWPVMLAALLSAVTWNFLFIPPLYTFRIYRLEDALMFGTYFVIALVTGSLTSRLRRQQIAERERERRATYLYRLIKSITEARTMDEALANAAIEMQGLFSADLAVLLVSPRQPDQLVPHLVSTFLPDDKEMAVATWSFKNRQNAGRLTDTLSAAAALYIPLRGFERTLGVLGVKPAESARLTLVERDILESFASQIAFLVEREQLREADEATRVLATSERLHRTLLDSVSHELKTPLSVITSAVAEIDKTGIKAGNPFMDEIRISCQRLDRLVDNLLDMTRVESGTLKPRRVWSDLGDLVNATVESVRDWFKVHQLEVRLPAGLPLVRIDFALMKQALSNLLMNAVVHTPPGTPVTVSAGVRSGEPACVFIEVADRGPGLPEGEIPRLFDKFSQGPNRKTGGLGLGLSIVRGLVDVHGGQVEAGNLNGGGARFTILLPLEKQEAVPGDEQ